MMTREDIPDFISGLLNCGCTVTSLGDCAYVIDDAPVAHTNMQVVKLNALIKQYGARDHLKADIIQYLRNSGNCIGVECAAA